jgi:hypothetical protein
MASGTLNMGIVMNYDTNKRLDVNDKAGRGCAGRFFRLVAAPAAPLRRDFSRLMAGQVEGADRRVLSMRRPWFLILLT